MTPSPTHYHGESEWKKRKRKIASRVSIKTSKERKMGLKTNKRKNPGVTTNTMQFTTDRSSETALKEEVQEEQQHGLIHPGILLLPKVRLSERRGGTLK